MMKEPRLQRFQKQPRITGLERPEISESLLTEVENLLAYPNLKRLNRNLRKMLMLYLSYEKDGLPLDFEDFMTDLYLLYEFLDRVEDEVSDQG